MVDNIEINKTTSNQIKIVPIMLALLISSFIGMFSETALNMALNSLIIEFQISASTAQWLTTGYLLVLGILIPVSGFLIKRYSTRKLFITSLCFSITGILVTAIAPSFWILLIGRIIQAVGTGILMPLLSHSVLILFPPEKRGAAMGIVGLVIMFAPAVGPIIAGLIIDRLNWHWIFWILLPFYVFALAFGMMYMKNLTDTSTSKIDVFSIILSTFGFGGLVVGFGYAGEEGWTSLIVLTSLFVGILSLIFFVLRQMSLKESMLNVRVFKKPMFSLGIIMTLFCNIIIFSTIILLPLYLQKGLGLSSTDAGLLLLPGGIINGIMALITGHLFDKFGPRWLVITGFSLSTLSVWMFSNISSTTQSWTIITFYTLLMVGMSMITTPSQTNGLNQLSKDLYPDGSAIVNTTIQTSGAIGTAIAISILNITEHTILNQVNNPSITEIQAGAFIAGIQNAFQFATIVSLIGLAFSFFIKRVMVNEEQLTIGSKKNEKLK